MAERCACLAREMDRVTCFDLEVAGHSPRLPVDALDRETGDFGAECPCRCHEAYDDN